MIRTGLGRFLPTALRREIDHLRLSHRLRNSLDLHALRPPKTFRGELVAVGGVFNTTTGLGRAAELVALTLERCGHRVVRVDVGRALGNPTTSHRKDYVTPGDCAALPISDVVLVMNPDACAVSVFDHYWLAARCVVGHWIWELEQLPSIWAFGVASYDEIWAPTQLVHDVIHHNLPNLNRPLKVVAYAVDADPMPATTPAERTRVRAGLGLADTTFALGYSFAVDSNYYRKNPEDAVRAFQLAYPTCKDTKVQLLLRCNDFSHRPVERGRLEGLIDSDARIRILDSRQYVGIRDFYAALDLYLSPSRAEGYGLNLVEAAQSGLPVITNGWRIPPDILSLPRVRATGFSIVDVDDPQGHYARIAGAVWSAPDIADMAGLIAQARQDFCAAEVVR